jgi:hypothetical protein
MHSQAAEIASRLAHNAEAVCRHYLSNGRREGRYWIVGDVANTPGHSLYVRLFGPLSGKGAAGKFTDAATGQHGDLLDLIALSCGFDHLSDVLDEARRFLGLPQPAPVRPPPAEPPAGLPEAVRKLLVTSYPLARTIAETYTCRDVHQRGWSQLTDHEAVQYGLDLLVNNDWLAENQVRTAGRPKMTYLINPKSHLHG